MGLLDAAARVGVAGIAAPSANRFGRVSPTRAAHVRDEFAAGVAGARGDSAQACLRILDGGACPMGIESTLVDCSRGRTVLLRPGVIGRERLEEVLGDTVAEADADAPRASGTLASHYAPRARVWIGSTADLQRALDRASPSAADRPQGLAVYSRTLAGHLVRPGDAVTRHTMPDDPVAAAHELFHVLRAFDALGVGEIWVEAVPPEAAWDGVRDRLMRASAPR
jgi:L-threonylcarbamoyladenylate synthase